MCNNKNISNDAIIVKEFVFTFCLSSLVERAKKLVADNNVNELKKLYKSINTAIALATYCKEIPMLSCDDYKHVYDAVFTAICLQVSDLYNLCALSATSDHTR